MRVAISMGHAFSQKGSKYQFDPGYVNPKFNISESEVVGLCGDLLIEILKYPVRIEAVRIPRCCLQERINMINALHKEKPFDLAIEIHMNAYRDQRVRGTEVWYDPKRRKSKSAAGVLNRKIVETLHSKDRGIKSSIKFAFLREVLPTPILTESEFLSNNIVAKEVEDFIIPKIAWAHAGAIWNLTKNPELIS